MTTEPGTAIEISTRKRRRAPTFATTAPTKSASAIKLLLRARGATSQDLIAATNWQPHSVRAFVSGLRKLGRAIVREPRKSGEFAYRIDTPNARPALMPAPLYYSHKILKLLADARHGGKEPTLQPDAAPIRV